MNNKTKGPSIATLIVPVMFLAFGIISLFLYSDLIFGIKVTNINKLLQQGTVGANVDSFVELDVDAVVENFAETSHKRNGITTGKDQHYMVWLDDDSMIAVSVRGKNVKAMDEIMDKTWDYIDGKTDSFTDTPLHLKGKLQNMSAEMKSYYQRSLDYYGLTSADRDIHYYIIDCTDSQLLAIIVTAFFFVVAIPMLFAFIKGRINAKRAALVAEDMGYSYQPYHAEYTTYGAESGGQAGAEYAPAEETPAAADPFEESPQDPETPAE